MCTYYIQITFEEAIDNNFTNWTNAPFMCTLPLPINEFKCYPEADCTCNAHTSTLVR